MKLFVYPYKMKSNSAKQIAKALSCKRVSPDGEFRNNMKYPIINWGNSSIPNWMLRWEDQLIFNHPDKVKVATNKLLTFKKFKEVGVKHPEWTTNRLVAEKWLEEAVVVIRKTLTGKAGQGIELALIGEHLPINAPLYTKYFKKKEEYRVHVVGDKVVDFVMKKKREGVEPNYQIRNADNGWVFCREGVVLPECVKEESIKAVKALGLHFGAVDVGYNVKKDEPCVFEVNSAPGIEGTTIISYSEAFKNVTRG